MAPVEDGEVLGSRRLDMENSGVTLVIGNPAPLPEQ